LNGWYEALIILSEVATPSLMGRVTPIIIRCKDF
jgi:hypothetical protein